MKKKFKTKKAPSKYDFETLRKDSVYLVQEMIEYGQRRELGMLQRTKVVITFDKGKKHGELFLTKPSFFVEGNKVYKIEGEKIIETDMNELNSTMASYKGGRVVIDKETMKALKKEFGDFEISL